MTNQSNKARMGANRPHQEHDTAAPDPIWSEREEYAQTAYSIVEELLAASDWHSAPAQNIVVPRHRWRELLAELQLRGAIAPTSPTDRANELLAACPTISKHRVMVVPEVAEVSDEDRAVPFSFDKFANEHRALVCRLADEKGGIHGIQAFLVEFYQKCLTQIADHNDRLHELVVGADEGETPPN